jgi:outer membrane lipase/esterase
MTRKLPLCLLAFLGLSLIGTSNAASLFGFGDSLVDNGNIPKITGLNQPPSPPYFHNRFSNGPTFVENLPSLLHLNASVGTTYGTGYDLAVGGAETGSKNFGNPLLPGLSTEIDIFTALGRRFGSRDLVVNWAGANDYFDLASQIQAGTLPLSQLQTAGALAVAQATANLATAAERFAALGARQMVFLNLPDLGQTPGFNRNPVLSAAASQLTDAHNQMLEANLARIHALTGANIFLFDANLAFKEILANPAKFGFSNVTDAAISSGLAFAPEQVQNTYLFWDNVHPTTAGHLLLARYIANMVEAPTTLASQTQLMAYGSSAFADLIYTQMGPYAPPATEPAAAPVEGKGMVGKKSVVTPPNVIAAPDKRFEIFLLADYRQGQRDDRHNSVGFDYYTGNVALGAQYRFNDRITAGLLFGYGYNKADLNSNQGHVSVDAYQVGGFLNFHGPNWFIGAIAAYGYDDYDAKRPGVLHDTLRGEPSGWTAEVGAKGGYFWNFGNLSVGPIASLTFVNVDVDGYSETGDPVLTQAVNHRSVQDLYGAAGLQIGYDIKMGGIRLQPFVYAQYEREFLGDGNTLVSRFTSQRALQINTAVQDSSQDYGRIGGGINARFSESISARIAADAVVGRDDGHEYTIDAGIGFSF